MNRWDRIAGTCRQSCFAGNRKSVVTLAHVFLIWSLVSCGATPAEGSESTAPDSMEPTLEITRAPAELDYLLANLEEIKVSNVGLPLTVRVYRVTDQMECHDVSENCPQTSLYVSVAQSFLVPKTATYIFPKTYGWQVVQVSKSCHVIAAPEDCVALVLESTMIASDKGRWTKEVWQFEASVDRYRLSRLRR